MVRPEAAISVDRSYEARCRSGRRSGSVLGFRRCLSGVLLKRGRRNPQILARDEHGGGSRDPSGSVAGGGPDKWWLTGPNYGLGTEHDSQAAAKAAAQRWADTRERPDQTNSES
jgi:hypothetical protein